MITDQEIKSYNEKGYLVVEGAIPPEKLRELQKVTDEFVQNSRHVKENDEIYDISSDHNSDSPNLRRLKKAILGESSNTEISFLKNLKFWVTVQEQLLN